MTGMSWPFDAVSFLHGPPMPNRFMLAPLTNQQSHVDGTLSDDERHWLVMRAQGGFGLTMTCAAHVQAAGQGFAGQLGIFGDEHLEGLTRLAADLNATGTVSYAQLHHAGNRAPAELIGAQPVCPSDDPETGARALTTDEVEQAVTAFVAAARRAQRAGFHGVELHGAHGYLICQFLSAELNRRTDRYGGSLENRSRFLFDIVAGVRGECGPDLALAVRLSPERFGMKVAEIVEVYGRLVDTGHVDLIDMSLWDHQRVAKDEGFEGRALIDIFAELPRGEVRLGVAGKIHDPADVRRVLDADVDVPVLGRVAILHHDYPSRLLADPHFVPRRPPVAPEVLAGEGVSPSFVAYLAQNFRFVASPIVRVSTPPGGLETLTIC
jgi:2,4-dienoyl-CoA reductase-like NADH-dependent reductase (Old Yellow Enzyme family)